MQSIEVTNTYFNLSDQNKSRLNEINKIKDYFNSEIPERKIMSKKLSKYIAAFDYFDKTLIVLKTIKISEKTMKISEKIVEMHKIKKQCFQHI